MVEIITGVERRRRWRPEDKARILAETEEAGSSIAIVARRHDISRGLLWHWRRAMRGSQAGLSAADGSAFLPVTVVGDSRASPQVPADRSIEIMLPGGVRVRVGLGRTSRCSGACWRLAVVIPVSSGVRVWLAAGHTDMRRGMNGLALQVQQALERDPHAGDLYVFRGRRGDLVKVLWHDGLGMSLYAKRLERGRFIWPTPADGTVAISASQLAYMLEGIDWRHPQRTWRPEMAG